MSFLNFAGNQGVTFKSFTSSGGTTYALDVPASTNSVMISAGGILQKPGTDYNCSGSTITTTSAITSGVVVDTWVIHKPGSAPVIQDNSISNAKMQDDAVGLAELSATGTPSSSTFLRGDNAWAAPAGGGFEFVSSTTVSGASIEFESLTGNYDYRLQFRNVTLAADAQLIMQFGTGGTPTYATANYQTQYARFEQAAAGYAGNDGSGQAHITLGASQNGSTPRSGYVEVYDLANASVFTSVWGILNSENNGGTELLDIFGGRLETAQADNSIKLDETAGTTFNGGSIALFRRPNA